MQQPLKIEGAVPGSFIEIGPSGSGDWYLKVCEGVDSDSMKTGAKAEFHLPPVGVKLYGPGKTTNSAQLSRELMAVLAEFYNSHRK